MSNTQNIQADNIPSESKVLPNQNIQAQEPQDIIKNINQDIQEIGIQDQDIQKFDINQLQEDEKNNYDNIQILQEVYKKTNNPEILTKLLQELIESYQFDYAKSYINQISTLGYSPEIDSDLYLHILINSLSITDSRDLIYFETQLENMSNKGYINKDDTYFYLGLIKIWKKDFNGANNLFKNILDSRYSKFINHFDTNLTNYSAQKDIPSYYTDAMISLTMLKNGYFSIAKKLSLNVLMSNDKYILPYQILAYSHFLTNNRETSIDYFLKLIDIDKSKEDNYKFMIGVSYYRLDKNEESVLYLSQIKNKLYQTDVHRYLILNYLEGNDIPKLVRTRQSLLGQNDLEKSDFYNYFYNTFYIPFRNQEPSSIYKENQTLAISFLDKCYQTFSTGDSDICIYGQAGQDITLFNREAAKDKLLYLAEKYPQSYIYHALGDYYNIKKDLQKAKTYYIKAVSSTTSETEKNIVRTKIIDQNI
ncbi:hypothetical protein K9M48_02095 [Candidatus Gracilibacteria bacterium]|nr:hypothetical protein [Candidatus Gracilibacteria bacterium]